MFRYGLSQFALLSALYGCADATPGSVESLRPQSERMGTAMLRVPKRIHQTWKTADASAWSPQLRRYVSSWTQQNPTWQHKVWDDAECEAFMATHHPDRLDVYHALPNAVERADMFRYAVVYTYGGLYADMDAAALEPIHTWLEHWQGQHDVTLLVGVEDILDSETRRAFGFARELQLEQWVFAAAPQHPALLTVLDTLCERVRAELRLHSPLTDDSAAILNRTGPGVWTDAILAYLEKGQNDASKELLQEPFLHDHTTLVLPRRAFGYVNNARSPRGVQWDAILVQHHYLGSWRHREQTL